MMYSSGTKSKRTTGYEKAKKQAEQRKKAKEELDVIIEEEEEEEKQAGPKSLLTGEIDWLQYLEPKKNELTDIEKCRELDAYNETVYEHNSAMLPKVNLLLSKLAMREHKLSAPPKYSAIARKKYEEMLFNKEFRILRAIEYLYEHGKIAVKDYRLVDGPKLADSVAETIYVEEQLKPVRSGDVAGIDISDTVGSSHKNNCTCNNLWDGESKRCMGEGLRIRWARQPGHHFLRPIVVPESY